MKNISIKILTILTISVLLFSCKKEETDNNTINPLEGLTKLSEGYATGAGMKVEIWAEKNFFAGYNKLVAAVYDSINTSQKITDASITFMPLMSMGMGETAFEHSSPVENPSAADANGVFTGAIAFTMPTSSEGTWSLGIKVKNNATGKEGKAEFNITVDNPTPSVITVFTALEENDPKLVLSFLEPKKPIVGMNDIEFTLHQKKTMMEWPVLDNYTIEITPEMPSMGHGSPNNVNPTSTGNGHYKGKVNFTMTGEWKINVVVKKDGTAVSENLFFTIVL